MHPIERRSAMTKTTGHWTAPIEMSPCRMALGQKKEERNAEEEKRR